MPEPTGCFGYRQAGVHQAIYNKAVEFHYVDNSNLTKYIQSESHVLFFFMHRRFCLCVTFSPHARHGIAVLVHQGQNNY